MCVCVCFAMNASYIFIQLSLSAIYLPSHSGDDRRTRIENINYPFEEYKLDYVFIWTMVCCDTKQYGNKDFYCNSVVIVDAMSSNVFARDVASDSVRCNFERLAFRTYFAWAVGTHCVRDACTQSGKFLTKDLCVDMIN